MSGTKERSVLLVGSVPLESSKAVFEAVGTKLGKVIKRMCSRTHRGSNPAAHENSREAIVSSSTK
jgi:hypothetical protein